MILGLALILLAIVLTDASGMLPISGYWRGRMAGSRLARLVPATSATDEIADRDARPFTVIRRIVRMVDPTFLATEQALHAIGVVRASTVIAVEALRLLAATFCAGLNFYVFQGDVRAWTFPPVAFLLVLYASWGLVKSIARSRSRRVLGEMLFAADLITIFLEGGQSLDQALRSLSEICGSALPNMASIQRALVEDLNNGLPYEKAFERWADNLDIDQARYLATLFIESLNHGTELAPQLRQFSSDLFEQRLVTARASIGTKSAHLTVVMIVFFLPAILAFVAAPAVISLMKGLGTLK